MRPECHALIVSADTPWRRALLKGLNAAAKEGVNPFGLRFDGVDSASEALQRSQHDGLLQCVLIDATGNQARAAVELVQQIYAARPTVDLYWFVDPALRDDLPDDLPRGALDGYFMHDDADPRGCFRIIQAELQEKAATPFYDALKSYVHMAKDAWHTPGHSSGDSLRRSPWVADFYDFAGENIMRADLSVSVDALDSLLDPKGVIAKAQAEAAWAFGAKQTYFATNGSSTANKVILQTLLAPGDKLLLDRNCHKSVHHGVIISGAHPVYLDSSLQSHYGLFGPVPRARILSTIDAHPDAKALILTSCTYDGLRYDLAPIIAAAHAKGIKVVIDEAWYAHARFHPSLRPTALEAGADYVTQSTHKMLSALSQASMIHVNDPDFDAHTFRENFNMHASTSPAYAIIASLDKARQQAVMEGYKLVSLALDMSQSLRASINATGIFKALTLQDLLPSEVAHDGIQLDPCKITVDISASGMTSDELQKILFERFNIQVEKSTFNTLTLLLTLGSTPAKLARLQDALHRIAEDVKRSNRPALALASAPLIAGFTRQLYLPRDAYYCDGEVMALMDGEEQANAELFGRVAADSIVPYPPGIPALVPGQEITADVLRYLLSLLKNHRRTDLHGVHLSGYSPMVRVMRRDEEQRYPRIG